MNGKPPGRGWVVLVGVLLVAVGLIFLLLPMLTSAVAGMVTGALLLVAGAGQAIHALFERERGWPWTLVLGALAVVAGAMFLADPLAGIVGVTLLLACYLLGTGVAKVVLAGMWSPAPGWGWMLFNGAITALLGLLVLTGWPATGLWTIGVFLGVDALLAGFARIVHALAEGGEPVGPIGHRL